MELEKLEQQAIFVLRESYKKFKNVGMLWSMGKDSTVMLHLAKRAFGGHVPFTLIHCDTTFKFPEMYEFRNKLVQDWDLNLKVYINQEALDSGMNYDNYPALEVCHQLKTLALEKAMAQDNYGALLLAIRADEDGSRGKERFFSKRNVDNEWDYINQGPEIWMHFNEDLNEGEHMRVHPLLHWTELDIWNYIKKYDVPLVSLYYSKNGLRYRSLGCMPITKPVKSNAVTVDEIVRELELTKESERSGRGQDKEDLYALQKLRKKGYM